eukprot:TRINITY_DN3128_c0_g1_i2.p1 TRINITY_DN3128_c0_g1~~TRINITY_DN3128_c0_g1_i2.p1  ORF type:complete len:162 (-),score=39.36 TRINITY_DN3128_c0_g1_i2:42-527(-)
MHHALAKLLANTAVREAGAPDTLHTDAQTTFVDESWKANKKYDAFILVNSASNLVSGLLRPDPYVIVQLCGQQQETKRVSKSTAPVFNQCFHFEGQGDSVVSLRVQNGSSVMKLSALGTCSVDLRQFAYNKLVRVDLLLQGVNQGRMGVALRYEFQDDEAP